MRSFHLITILLSQNTGSFSKSFIKDRSFMKQLLILQPTNMKVFNIIKIMIFRALRPWSIRFIAITAIISGVGTKVFKHPCRTKFRSVHVQVHVYLPVVTMACTMQAVRVIMLHPDRVDFSLSKHQQPVFIKHQDLLFISIASCTE